MASQASTAPDHGGCGNSVEKMRGCHTRRKSTRRRRSEHIFTPSYTSPRTAWRPGPWRHASASVWGFGGLLKTLTTQSETVLDAYRRDLAEFSTGLHRETDALRDAAARAAWDLPSSAHALDGFADIVALAQSAAAQAAAAASSASAPAPSEESEPSGHLRHYSRFEAQLRALQADPATFAADPEDAPDFAAYYC